MVWAASELDTSKSVSGPALRVCSVYGDPADATQQPSIMKILIVDDDPIVRVIVQRVVSQLGHESVEAEDGLAALGMLETEDPDVLVTDVRMPILDGFELVAGVRATSRHRDMPIVCLSAVADREAITRLAALGITDYLLKPIRPRDLLERLTSVIAKHGAWKLERDSPDAERVAPVVLVIDADADFRSMVASALAPEFEVVQAISGTNGGARFRSQTGRVAAAIVSEGLEFLDEERSATLIRDLASQRGVRPPVILLVSAADAATIAPEKAARFDGVVRRTAVPDEFLAAVAPWLPKRSVVPPVDAPSGV
jgi:two-component system cell cycle response regulator